MAETAEKSAALPDRVPQPHGGALLRGGKKGNRGGRGRLPSVLRERLRSSAANYVHVLEEVAAGFTVTPIVERCPKCGHEPEGPTELPQIPKVSERVQAVNVMLSHGLGEQALTVGFVAERVTATADLLRRSVPPDVYDALAPQLRAIWNGGKG